LGQGSRKTRPVALSLSVPDQPIENLREELLGIRNLLSALAGPSVAVAIEAAEGARPVWLTTEDLTRVLVNLVKNSAEAIQASMIQGSTSQGTAKQGSGSVTITLSEKAAGANAPLSLQIAVEDSGPGIDPSQLEAVFEPGFTTNTHAAGSWPAAHRGLGLFICRSIVDAAGGRMMAGNRTGMGAGSGARIEIELPVRAQ
jgi:signal transduction histidine kinase